MLAVIVAVSLTAIPARADRDHPSDKGVGTAEAISRSINQLGYDLRRLKAEHGMYEARLVDRESGGGVKAHFDGKSGELLRAELIR
jgi:hypothetical protein